MGQEKPRTIHLSIVRTILVVRPAASHLWLRVVEVQFRILPRIQYAVYALDLLVYRLLLALAVPQRQPRTRTEILSQRNPHPLYQFEEFSAVHRLRLLDEFDPTFPNVHGIAVVLVCLLIV